MVRSFLCLLVFIVFLIWTIPVQLIVYLLRLLKLNRAAELIAYYVARIFLFFPLWFMSGTKLEVRGRQYLPGIGRDEAVLFVGNHCSYFDIILSYCCFRGCTGYVGKKELGRVPLLGSWMIAIGCILLDRNNIKDGIRMADTAAKNIANGTSMVIFPEGTRNRHEDEQLLGEFHAGSLRIAQKALCKVVPMTISGSADVLEKHFPRVKSTKVIIEFSEPIDAAKLDRPQLKALAQTTREIILAVRERHAGELGQNPVKDNP
jgi:1-acyl-sn-glycerol-3-phosphate acyltransferase